MIKRFLRDNKALLKDNFILFSAIFSTNILNYIYHFFLGRSLGPADYGVFGALLAIIYVIAMPLMAIQTIITKFVSEFKEDKGKVSYLLVGSLKKMTLYGVLMLILFLIVSPFISSFLKIGSLSPLILISLFLLFGFLIPITRGVLQGLQNFKGLGATYITEGFSKLLVGIGLVTLGFGVSGAISGFVVSYFVPLVLTLYLLRKIMKSEKVKFDSKAVYKYSLPVIIMLVSLTMFYTIDIALVKHFFGNVDAGLYAALALLGKVIFFGSFSISMVMFPKVSELFTQNRKSKGILYKSLLLVLGLGGVATLIYFLFPGLIINLLFGKEYLAVKGLVGMMGLVMTIYSLVYTISFYNVSLNRKNFIYVLIFSNIVELGLIWFFHSSLMQVLTILLIIISLLFLYMIIYTIKNEKTIDYNPSLQ